MATTCRPVLRLQDVLGNRPDRAVHMPPARLPRQAPALGPMPPRDRVHPNEKPIEMVAHFINNHTYRGDMVLDPFMGSGSSGVAAVRMGRKFIGIELEPAHFETALGRLRAAQEGDMFLGKPAPAIQEALL